MKTKFHVSMYTRKLNLAPAPVCEYCIDFLWLHGMEDKNTPVEQLKNQQSTIKTAKNNHRFYYITRDLQQCVIETEN